MNVQGRCVMLSHFFYRSIFFKFVGLWVTNRVSFFYVITDLSERDLHHYFLSILVLRGLVYFESKHI